MISKKATKDYLGCRQHLVHACLCTNIYSKLGERSASKGRGPRSGPEKTPLVLCSISRVVLLEWSCNGIKRGTETK